MPEWSAAEIEALEVVAREYTLAVVHASGWKMTEDEDKAHEAAHDAALDALMTASRRAGVAALPCYYNWVSNHRVCIGRGRTCPTCTTRKVEAQ